MSTKIGVNDPCPCGSNKKYKKCYLKQNENCSLYIKERDVKIIAEFPKILQFVVDSLLRASQDLHNLFYKTDEDVEIISPLMQLIGIFTIIDVLGSYWYQYLNKTASQSERFDEFVNRFCFVNTNKDFLNRKYLATITAEDLRNLRNNIVHFYGLGKDHRFCIIPNLSKNADQALIDLNIKNFSKIRTGLVFIQPFELKTIIIEGAVGMLEHFEAENQLSNSDEKRLIYINNIERIHRKLMEEGAVNMNKEMAERIDYALKRRK